MDDINVYGETGIFIIKEQIFSKNGLPSIGHFSPSAVQIQRYVYQLRKEQEVFGRDERSTIHSSAFGKNLRY